MDQNLMIACRGCNISFPIKTIVQHATKKASCNTAYSQEQLEALRIRSKEISNAKHKIKMAERYQIKKSHYREKNRVDEPSTSSQEKLSVELLSICKSCKIKFEDTSILRHITHEKSCQNNYDDEDIKFIRSWSKEREKMVASDYYQENSEKIRLKNKEYWTKNETLIQRKRREQSEKRDVNFELLERRKTCKRKLGETKLLAHLGQKDSCKQNYSEEELTYINDKARERKNWKDSEYYETNKVSIAERKSESYKKKTLEKKEEFRKKRIEGSKRLFEHNKLAYENDARTRNSFGNRSQTAASSGCVT